MYRAVELRRLREKPRISDISLKVLSEYYESYLNPFIYHYQIINQNQSNQNIELRFNSENFCHLLGVESIAKNSVKSSELCQYRGIRGWKNIKSGRISMKHLKQLNLKKFKSVKAKYVYFYLLPTLLEHPLGVRYNREKVVPPTRIECELLFYSLFENAVIHLGIEKDSSEPYYIPRTFFVEKLSEDAGEDIYIRNQEKVEIHSHYRVILID